MEYLVLKNRTYMNYVLYKAILVYTEGLNFMAHYQLATIII